MVFRKWARKIREDIDDNKNEKQQSKEQNFWIIN
jgi:hypothetical protein